MKQKIEALRKLAVKMLLSGEKIKEVCERTGFSKFWVYKWYKRYLKGDKLWFKEHSRAPYSIPHKTPPEIEQAVISIRKKLQQKDGFKGAQRIRWEMEDLNYEYIPSISTINAILKRNNLIEHNEKRFNPKGKNYPSIKFERQNELHEVDLLGPRYLKGGIRFYLLNVIDVFSHRVGIEILQSKYDEIIAEALIRIWKRLGLPQYLQLDNQSPFRGSDRHPRSFGIVIKLCLSLNIQPVFIPLNEPWRNGCIEKFGDTYQRYFLRKYRFNGIEDLIYETQKFEFRHNHTYRYSTIHGKTPMKVMSEYKDSILKLPQDYQFDKDKGLSEGFIHIVRLIRSDRKLDIFGEKFILPKETVYEYVWCTIDVKEQKLRIFLDNKQIEEFDYKLPKSYRCT